MDLVLGLIEPSEGSILVDGHNIKENLKSWQGQIGYVPQDVLYDGLFRFHLK